MSKNRLPTASRALARAKDCVEIQARENKDKEIIDSKLFFSPTDFLNQKSSCAQ